MILGVSADQCVCYCLFEGVNKYMLPPSSLSDPLTVSVRGYHFGLDDSSPNRKKVPRIPEYYDLSQDSQLLKPTVEISTIEPNSISNYPNGYTHICGCMRAQSIRSAQYHSLSS